MNDTIKYLKNYATDYFNGKHTGKIVTQYKSIPIKVSLILVVIAYCFFFSSSFIFTTDYNISATKLRTTIELSEHLTVTPQCILFCEAENVLNAYFEVSDMYNGYQTEFETSALLRDKTISLLESKIASKHDEFLVVEVKNVPKKFSAVRIDLQKKSAEKETAADENQIQNDETSAKVYVTTENISVVESLPKSEEEYFKSCIDESIKLIQDEINSLTSKITDLQKVLVDNNNVIKIISNKISSLDEEKVKESNQIIRTKQSENQTLQSEIDEHKNEIVSLKNRLDSLKKRIK